MQIPQNFLDSIRSTAGFNESSFIEAHKDIVPYTSIRINASKITNINEISSLAALVEEKVQWSEMGWYLKSRPSFTFDPLFHAGCYYVQEASSMFLEHAIRQHLDLSSPLRILDGSAAPGGKSTHIQSLISDRSLLVSNEVIRSRAGILKDNVIKWGGGNVIVTNNDPKDFAKLEGYFDAIVVDAPCSGSGLFRKDVAAIDEWSLSNVALCSQRQQRILADILPALKKDGILVYSTCSYSVDEDEEIVKWLTQEFGLESLKIELDASWNITESVNEGRYGYRFWPDKLKGEGFFLACLRNTKGSSFSRQRSFKESLPSKSHLQLINRWTEIADRYFYQHENTVYAWPTQLHQDFLVILNTMKVIYSGVKTGELMRDKLVPDHALALSGLVRNDIGRVDVNYENAIRYLQRKDMVVNSSVKGWVMVTYEGHSLGWANILSNRINNYYPKELRILKDNDD